MPRPADGDASLTVEALLGENAIEDVYCPTWNRARTIDGSASDGDFAGVGACGGPGLRCRCRDGSGPLSYSTGHRKREDFTAARGADRSRPVRESRSISDYDRMT
jgi:hypothetical protein